MQGLRRVSLVTNRPLAQHIWGLQGTLKGWLDRQCARPPFFPEPDSIVPSCHRRSMAARGDQALSCEAPIRRFWRERRVAGADLQPARCVELRGLGMNSTYDRIASAPGNHAPGHGDRHRGPWIWEIGDLIDAAEFERGHARRLAGVQGPFSRSKLSNWPDAAAELCRRLRRHGSLRRRGASLSCCIRRRRLGTTAANGWPSAGEAVLLHILDRAPRYGRCLDGAAIDGPWLSAGVIQPGIRPRYRDGVFVIGNAAGEAHPVVAEGISMAMQSAWLLAERLRRCPSSAKLDIR